MVSLVKQNYNENKELYEKVEKVLRKELNKSIPINHVGSTAIPTIMYGKNIIDVLIGAKDKEQFEQITDILIKDVMALEYPVEVPYYKIISELSSYSVLMYLFYQNI